MFIEIFYFREKWTFVEDLQLLTESLKTPKKWTTIARKFVTRNCHQIKNRFICLLSKELDCSRDKIRELINENLFTKPISIVLEKITKNKNDPKKKIIFLEEKVTCHDVDFNEENNFEQFINFQKNSFLMFRD